MDNIRIPNLFYDLIVFLTPSLTFTLCLIIGLGDFAIEPIEVLADKINSGGVDFIAMALIGLVTFIFLAYEYGRLTEALSSWINALIKALRTKGIFFRKNSDFSIDFENEIRKLNLHNMLDPNRMDKWTIFFYAMRFQPRIGADILKRYAWEKLSRSSCFTFLVLLTISLVFKIEFEFRLLRFIGLELLDTGNYGFGSLTFTFNSFILFLLTLYEFYRRKSWNNDLLIKVLPVISLPSDFKIDIVNNNQVSSDVYNTNDDVHSSSNESTIVSEVPNSESDESKNKHTKSENKENLKSNSSSEDNKNFQKKKSSEELATEIEIDTEIDTDTDTDKSNLNENPDKDNSTTQFSDLENSKKNADSNIEIKDNKDLPNSDNSMSKDKLDDI